GRGGVCAAGAEGGGGGRAGRPRGQRLDRFIPGGHRERHHRHIRAFAETGVSARPMGGERVLSAVRANGEEFPIEAQISQATVAGQKLLSVIIRDVTERQAAAAGRERLLAVAARPRGEGGVAPASGPES